jgi:DNA invertase Pin-like site-specific DNA recombinase
MRAFLYARVGTGRQTQDLEQQLARLRAAALQRGQTVAGEFVDNCSGIVRQRRGLNQLLDRVLEGPVQPHVVLITAPDRLAHETDLREDLEEELRQHGCTVQYMQDAPAGPAAD